VVVATSMTIDLSPEALALYRSYRITDPDVVLALIDALEEARAALRTFVDMQPGGPIWISAGQFRRARAALEGKPAP
jgi:hypothetical protein